MMSKKLIKYYTVKIEGKPARVDSSSALGTLLKVAESEEDASVFEIDFSDPRPEDRKSLREWQDKRKREIRIARLNISKLWKNTMKVSDEVRSSWFSDSPNHRGLIINGGIEIICHYEE
jgi:hypothetical protein